MSSENIKENLEHIASADDFVGASYELTDAWTTAGVGAESIDPILRFMEAHPTLEYGAPGPLVHFMETFYRKELEEKITESVNRKPIVMNIWMLNRLINDAKGKSKEMLLAIMRQAGENHKTDEHTRERIKDFLTHQESRG